MHDPKPPASNNAHGAAPPLPPLRLTGFGLLALPLAALGIPLFILLPAVYADDLGLGFAAVGTALLLARLSDAATDPLVGWLSDRVRLPGGWRRPWIVLGTGLAMAAVAALFLVDGAAPPSLTYLLWWSVLLYFGWTLMQVPYTAWAVDLSGEYHERTRVMGYREGFVVVGTVLAVALPSLLGLSGVAALNAVGWGLLVLFPLAAAITLLSVAEPVRTAVQPGHEAGRAIGWRAGGRLLLANRPFLRLLLGYFLNGLANGLPATLFIPFVTYRLGQPDWAGPLLLVYFLAGLLSVPVWLRLSRRIGKHRAWCWAMLGTCAVFVGAPLLGTGDAALFAVICVLTGATLGADLVLPGAMQADVIDVDRAGGGGERSGLYVALWGLATKASLALAVGIAFPALEALGFSTGPDGAVAHGAVAAGTATTLGLALLYAALPIPLKLAAIALLWSHPLDAAAQARLRAAIDASPSKETDHETRVDGAARRPSSALGV